MESLRIAMVTPALAPHTLGGLPNVVDDLASGLTAAGHHVTVHAPRAAGVLGAPAAPYPVHWHRRIPMPWDLLGTAGNPWTPGLRRSLGAQRYDVMHLHSQLFLTSLAGARAAHESRTPYVVSVHGWRAERGGAVDGLQDAWLATGGRWILRGAAAIACFNEDDAAHVRKVVRPATPVELMANPFDDRLFQPGPAPGRRDVVWVGRMVPEKGLPLLVEAWAHTAASRRGVRLQLVGDGPERRGLQDLVAHLGVGETVDLVLAVPRPQVAHMLQQAALLAFPSAREGMPLAVIEAMACGTPVLADAHLGGLVGPAGAVVANREPEAWAAAIDGLLDDAATRAEMGRAGRRRAEGRHDPGRVLEAHVALYRKALDASVGGPAT